ncbi:unnamed protein product [Rotaria sp. Silwood2]|nr:unnamed protein product [Rotaria sp. Silwood2]
MLSNGRKYIIPCQSRFSRQSINDIANAEYNSVSNTVKKSLGDNRMSSKDDRATQAFSELESIIDQLYTKPLSPKLYRRARREYKNVKRLQKLLRRRPDVIIRRVDKGEGFYFGNKSLLESKTEEYMNQTEAYEQITNGQCPLADILHTTVAVLDYLLKKQAITKHRRDKLVPDESKLELAHLYITTKVHKVILFWN